MTNVLEQVRQTASDIFGIPVRQLTAESSPQQVKAWDSIQHLNLVLALEQKFVTQFEPEEIDEMKTLGAIARLLEEKSNGARQAA